MANVPIVKDLFDIIGQATRGIDVNIPTGKAGLSDLDEIGRSIGRQVSDIPLIATNVSDGSALQGQNGIGYVARTRPTDSFFRENIVYLPASYTGPENTLSLPRNLAVRGKNANAEDLIDNTRRASIRPGNKQLAPTVTPVIAGSGRGNFNLFVPDGLIDLSGSPLTSEGRRLALPPDASKELVRLLGNYGQSDQVLSGDIRFNPMTLVSAYFDDGSVVPNYGAIGDLLQQSIRKQGYVNKDYHQAARNAQGLGKLQSLLGSDYNRPLSEEILFGQSFAYDPELSTFVKSNYKAPPTPLTRGGQAVSFANFNPLLAQEPERKTFFMGDRGSYDVGSPRAKEVTPRQEVTVPQFSIAIDGQPAMRSGKTTVTPNDGLEQQMSRQAELKALRRDNFETVDVGEGFFWNADDYNKAKYPADGSTSEEYSKGFFRFGDATGLDSEIVEQNLDGLRLGVAEGIRDRLAAVAPVVNQDMIPVNAKLMRQDGKVFINDGKARYELPNIPSVSYRDAAGNVQTVNFIKTQAYQQEPGRASIRLSKEPVLQALLPDGSRADVELEFNSDRPTFKLTSGTNPSQYIPIDSGMAKFLNADLGLGQSLGSGSATSNGFVLEDLIQVANQDPRSGVVTLPFKQDRLPEYTFLDQSDPLGIAMNFGDLSTADPLGATTYKVRKQLAGEAIEAGNRTLADAYTYDALTNGRSVVLNPDSWANGVDPETLARHISNVDINQGVIGTPETIVIPANAPREVLAAVKDITKVQDIGVLPGENGETLAYYIGSRPQALRYRPDYSQIEPTAISNPQRMQSVIYRRLNPEFSDSGPVQAPANQIATERQMANTIANNDKEMDGYAFTAQGASQASDPTLLQGEDDSWLRQNAEVMQAMSIRRMLYPDEFTDPNVNALIDQFQSNSIVDLDPEQQMLLRDVVNDQALGVNYGEYGGEGERDYVDRILGAYTELAGQGFTTEDLRNELIYQLQQETGGNLSEMDILLSRGLGAGLGSDAPEAQQVLQALRRGGFDKLIPKQPMVATTREIVLEDEAAYNNAIRNLYNITGQYGPLPRTIGGDIVEYPAIEKNLLGNVAQTRNYTPREFVVVNGQLEPKVEVRNIPKAKLKVYNEPSPIDAVQGPLPTAAEDILEAKVNGPFQKRLSDAVRAADVEPQVIDARPGDPIAPMVIQPRLEPGSYAIRGQVGGYRNSNYNTNLRRYYQSTGKLGPLPLNESGAYEVTGGSNVEVAKPQVVRLTSNWTGEETGTNMSDAYAEASKYAFMAGNLDLAREYANKSRVWLEQEVKRDGVQMPVDAMGDLGWNVYLNTPRRGVAPTIETSMPSIARRQRRGRFADDLSLSRRQQQLTAMGDLPDVSAAIARPVPSDVAQAQRMANARGARLGSAVALDPNAEFVDPNINEEQLALLNDARAAVTEKNVSPELLELYDSYLANYESARRETRPEVRQTTLNLMNAIAEDIRNVNATADVGMIDSQNQMDDAARAALYIRQLGLANMGLTPQQQLAVLTQGSENVADVDILNFLPREMVDELISQAESKPSINYRPGYRDYGNVNPSQTQAVDVNQIYLEAPSREVGDAVFNQAVDAAMNDEYMNASPLERLVAMNQGDSAGFYLNDEDAMVAIANTPMRPEDSRSLRPAVQQLQEEVNSRAPGSRPTRDVSSAAVRNLSPSQAVVERVRNFANNNPVVTGLGIGTAGIGTGIVTLDMIQNARTAAEQQYLYQQYLAQQQYLYEQQQMMANQQPTQSTNQGYAPVMAVR